MHAYVDENDIINDFGIIDTEARQSEGFDVTATLFKQQGTKYQRITINGWEVEHKEVRYNSFNFYVSNGSGRYTIGIGHPIKQEVDSFNKEYRTIVNDTIDVLGSDPSFSAPVNLTFSIVGLVRTPTYPEYKLNEKDYRISFIKSIFYIDEETNMLIE